MAFRARKVLGTFEKRAPELDFLPCRLLTQLSVLVRLVKCECDAGVRLCWCQFKVNSQKPSVCLRMRFSTHFALWRKSCTTGKHIKFFLVFFSWLGSVCLKESKSRKLVGVAGLTIRQLQEETGSKTYILNWPLPAGALQGRWNKQLK